MSRQRVVVYGPNNGIIHTQFDANNTEVTDSGALIISGETTGVVFANKYWSKITTEVIED